MSDFRFEQGLLPGDSAMFSEDRRYRYLLERGTGSPALGVIMLNPSTGDATQDDPTIRRVKGFAERWGYPKIRIANLFAFCATDPKELKWAEDPIGPKNNDHLRAMLASSDLVVAAWGANDLVEAHKRDRFLRFHCLSTRTELYCFAEGKKGTPSHPLYVRYCSAPLRWSLCPLLGGRN